MTGVDDEGTIMVARGDRLLEHVLQGGNGGAANDLLREFFRGYPLDRLRLLLYSENEEAVAAGVFIAAELGAQGTGLLADVARLLDREFATVSRMRWVRSDVLDAIVVNATPAHGEAIARAVRLIHDPDDAVRWSALGFLAKASKEQLGAALPHLADTAVATRLAWLLDSEGTPTGKQDVVARLDDDDPLTRRFAAAAVARLGRDDLVPLRRAAASTDPEVSRFAKHELAVTLEVEEVRQRQTAKRPPDQPHRQTDTDPATQPGNDR